MYTPTLEAWRDKMLLLLNTILKDFVLSYKKGF